MICKGCNQDKKLVKAHVIPESFFRDLRADEKTLKLISNVEGVHTKKTPIGVYDKEILCRECEDKFQTLDDYAAKLLIVNSEIEELKQNGALVGYKIPNVDYGLLKRFIISLLWRASISKHEFYSKVNLGALEEQAKKLIWEESAGEKDEFSFVLAKFDDEGTISKAMLDPHQERWYGKRYYRFYIGSFVLYVKADSQITPEQWVKFIPSDDNLYVVSRGKIEQSKEFPVLLSGFKTNTS
ncbi:hypothetical protein [Methylophaga sp. OBS1]|uniref:hypothetical protein n=1 Tax=Methylophaga sp. OBS1 TaxID=2991933 RepID=UPI00224CB529|nr:hypothetical protein [Methylophaga sp. OBS1]MCX4193124.1 hypothetical protein [Methylophaga sp. OBS1]